MKIIKRNGQEAIFDEVKITNAIIGANKEVVETERLSEEEIILQMTLNINVKK